MHSVMAWVAAATAVRRPRGPDRGTVLRAAGFTSGPPIDLRVDENLSLFLFYLLNGYAERCRRVAPFVAASR